MEMCSVVRVLCGVMVAFGFFLPRGCCDLKGKNKGCACSSWDVLCESDELAKRNLVVQTEAPVPVLPSWWSAAACAPYLLADTLVAD